MLLISESSTNLLSVSLSFPFLSPWHIYERTMTSGYLSLAFNAFLTYRRLLQVFRTSNQLPLLDMTSGGCLPFGSEPLVFTAIFNCIHYATARTYNTKGDTHVSWRAWLFVQYLYYTLDCFDSTITFSLSSDM